MPIKLLVLQHNTWERCGGFLVEVANKNDVILDTIEVWHEEIPALAGYDGLLVLGGGPNVDQEDKFPFLIREKEAIRQCLSLDLPYLGFCLGHQLLAEALGARVGKNFTPSIGYVKGYLTCAGRKHPAFKNLPRTLPLLKWHSQAVLEPVPRNLSVLMTSRECQVEAFSVVERPHVLGLQFDNHAACAEDVTRWLAEDAVWLKALLGSRFDPTWIVRYTKEDHRRLKQQFQLFFRNYIKIIS